MNEIRTATSERTEPGIALTQRQLLIWTEQTLAPDLPANNMAMSFTLAGAIDPDGFDRAFRSVVDSCEAMRTVVQMVEDSPRRFVRPTFETVVEHLDFSNEADPMTTYEQWRDRRCQRRFDLERSLFDCALVTLGPRSSVWYLCQHHLICDAWSFGLIFDRTSKLYEDPFASLDPEPVGLSEKQLASEQSYLVSDRHAEDRSFWNARFALPVEPLRPYGLDPSSKGAALRYASVELGSERSARIRSLAEEEATRAATPTLGLSLLFTTALYSYLHRTTGNMDLGIGSPVHNRPSRWSKSAVGRYAETCPMRVQLDEGETFRSLRKKVVEESYAVLAHARCSLANPIYAKRYDAMLNFHNAAMRKFSGLSVETDLRTGLGSLPRAGDAGSPTANRTWLAGELLTLNVHDFEGSGVFRLGFEFSADVFDDSLRRRAVEHFMNLLDAMLDDPGQRIDSAPLATPVELAESPENLPARRLEEPAPVADSIDSQSILARFREQVARVPDRIAVVSQGRALSYAALDDSVHRLSALLRTAGVLPGDLVGVLLPRSSTLLVSLLAIHDAGATYLPIETGHPAERIRMILADATPTLVLTDAAYAERLPPDGPPQVRLDAGWDQGAPAPPPPALLEPFANGLAYVDYTPSASGPPRGVEIEHASLSNAVTCIARRIGLNASDRVLAMTTSPFDLSAIELFLPLVVGGSVEIVDKMTCQNPDRLFERLNDRAVTLAHASTAVWRMLIDEGWSGRRGLRLLATAEGDPMLRELADKLLERADEVWQACGALETSTWSSIEQVARGADRVSIGRPVDGATLHVLSPTLGPLPLGVPGELYVGGAALARGYRGRPEETARDFVARPGEPGDRLYKTGECARRAMDGRIECLGRRDGRVTIRGVRIELGEIEAALLRVDEVSEAVVVVADDAEQHRTLVVHVVFDKERTGEVDALAERLRAQLPNRMMPSHWQVLDQIPVAAGGKVNRAALVRDWRARTGIVAGGDPPRDDVEVEIASLWRELLGVSNVTRDDDFFDLGGQSLLAVEAVRRLSVRLGRRIDLATFFEHSSVAGLREALTTSGLQHARTLAVELRRGSLARPLFCIGGVHLYHALAGAFTMPLTVYGISVHQELDWIEAVERGERPNVPSTEETARECIATIRQYQPHGPYRLAGLSYGGVLAYEIAHQLNQLGEEVDGLVLLDARLRSALAGARGAFGGLRRFLRRLLNPAPGTGWRWRAAFDREELRDRLFVEAVVRYERNIEPYSGSALLCRARGHALEEIEFDETLGWGRLVGGGLEFADCEGDHVDLLSSTHAVATASGIERYLSRHA